ncbi:hypothetical protein [Hufsiella ginkgonis]|uniref:Uncharacterized protein n=1 Tax=Hufsiella ginkgonis TaxID=2695274 RepID=A0A7K1XZP7_9SPHI|nr:hypothetical protein [Hufsiella ginkgonis]MXV16495.1 hypothetical protein [Hufsiella ginkgonis]
MELEEMKAAWEDLGRKVEKQDKLTHQMIEKMTEQRYRSRLDGIALPEKIATVFCFVFAAALILNFYRIHQPLMQVFGALSVAYLVVLPLISLSMLRDLKKISLSDISYAEAIRRQAQKRIRFQKFQVINLVASFAFMLVFFPVLIDMMGKSVAHEPYFWMLVVPFGIAIFLGASFWVLRCYNRTLSAAESLLAEIDQ